MLRNRSHSFAVAALAGLLSFAMSQTDAAAQSASPSGDANFSGTYAGAHVGGGFGRAGSAKSSGLVGGVQAGVNIQSGKVVGGVEADVSLSNQSATNFANRYKQGTGGSLRARAGYVVDRVMLYGTAGGAIASTEWQSPAGKSNKTATGWVYGAGAEVMMTPNITVRGEYLHYDYGRETYTTAIGAGTVKPTNNVLRAGVNYKF